MSSKQNWFVGREVTKTMDDQREALAAYAHNAWSRWMRHLFEVCHQCDSGEVIVPADLVSRWQRQIATSYDELSVLEQASDQREADRILSVVRNGH